MGDAFNQPLSPGVIPHSVTHLRLSSHFNQPLQAGSIPHGGVVYLHLGRSFNQPLLSGMLPTSLRELVLSEYYCLAACLTGWSCWHSTQNPFGSSRYSQVSYLRVSACSVWEESMRRV